MRGTDLWHALFNSVALHYFASSMCNFFTSPFTHYGQRGRVVLVSASGVLALIAVAVSWLVQGSRKVCLASAKGDHGRPFRNSESGEAEGSVVLQRRILFSVVRACRFITRAGESLQSGSGARDRLSPAH